MRSAFNKGIIVPGSRRVYNETNLPMFDKKGRCVWEMPKPSKVAIHNGVVKVGSKTRREPIEVPVYRGVDAGLARAYRAGLRRDKRKAAEKKTGPQVIDIPEDLIEEVTND